MHSMFDLWLFFGPAMCQKHWRKRLSDSRSVRFLLVEPFFGQFMMLSPGHSNTRSLLHGHKHRERHWPQLHSRWRYGCDLFMDQLLGLSGPLFQRPVAEKLWLSSIGLRRHRRCDMVTVPILGAVPACVGTGPVRVMCQDDSTSSCGSVGSLHEDAAAMEVASEGSPHDGDVDGSATEEIEDDGGDTARPSLDAVFAAYTPPISREAFPPVDGIRLQRHADGSWQVWFPGAHSPASERWSWAGAHEPEGHTHPEAASVPPPKKASKRSGCHRPN